MANDLNTGSYLFPWAVKKREGKFAHSIALFIKHATLESNMAFFELESSSHWHSDTKNKILFRNILSSKY